MFGGDWCLGSILFPATNVSDLMSRKYFYVLVKEIKKLCYVINNEVKYVELHIYLSWSQFYLPLASPTSLQPWQMLQKKHNAPTWHVETGQRLYWNHARPLGVASFFTICARRHLNSSTTWTFHSARNAKFAFPSLFSKIQPNPKLRHMGILYRTIKEKEGNQDSRNVVLCFAPNCISMTTTIWFLMSLLTWQASHTSMERLSQFQT